MTLRKSTAAKALGLPALVIGGFLVATTLTGVGVAAGITTSTSTTTTTTTTTTTPQGEEGCTPGFWKNHPEDYPAAYSPSTTLGSVFEVPAAYDGLTFDRALALRGGGINALLRHAVSALLNAASADVDYSLSVANVISMTNAAILSGDFETTKDVFDDFNNQSAPGFCD